MERKLVIEEPVFREDTLAGNAAVRLQSSGKPATCLLLTDEKSRLTGYLPAADLFRHAVVRHGPGVEPGVLRGTELPYGAGRSERRPPAAGKRTAGHRGGRVRPSTGYLGRNACLLQGGVCGRRTLPRDIFSQAQYGVVILGPDGWVSWANQSARTLLDRQDILEDMPLEELIPDFEPKSDGESGERAGKSRKKQASMAVCPGSGRRRLCRAHIPGRQRDTSAAAALSGFAGAGAELAGDHRIFL